MGQRQRLNIGFNGIQRNKAVFDTQNGDLNENLNVRKKHGSFRPVGRKSLYKSLNTSSFAKEVYRHTALPEDNFICYDYDGHLIRYMNCESHYHATTIKYLEKNEAFQYFTHLNNILICVTDQNKYIFIYDNSYEHGTTEGYRELIDFVMPTAWFVPTDATTKERLKADMAQSFSFEEAKEEAYSLFLEDRRGLRKDGYLAGEYVMIRFAFRLFDGTYIKHSRPYFFKPNTAHPNIYLKTQDVAGNYFTAYDQSISTESAHITGYKAQANIKLSSNNQLPYKKYKGLIKSLDIFYTQPIDIFQYAQFDEITENPSSPNGFWEYFDFPFNEKVKTIMEDTTNFYKVQSIDFIDLLDTLNSESDNTYTVQIEPGDLEQIPTKQQLFPDDFSHHEVFGNNAFVYNSRIHYGNMTTKLFNGYDNDWYNEDSDQIDYWVGSGYAMSSPPTEKLYAEVYLKDTINEGKIVRHEMDFREYWQGVVSYVTLGHVISYPDSRAYIMKLIYYDGSDYYLLDTLDLKSHNLFNIAYYTEYDSDNNELGVIKYEVNLGIPNGSYNTTSLETESKVMTDENRVQVTALDNPLSHPSDQSYQVGMDKSTVLAISTVVEAVSEGQFGSFPLYVFTATGIWSLNQGQGEVLYQTVTPVSNDICNNAKSVIPVLGGVIFSKEKGLYFISGRQVKKISDSIEGAPENNILNSDATYYAPQLQYLDIKDKVAKEDFLDYLPGAVICYDHIENELIVSNPDYNYSYVFEFENNIWHSIDQSFTKFAQIFPGYYGLCDSKLYKMNDEDMGDVPILIHTKAMRLTGTNLKKVLRSMLNVQGTIESEGAGFSDGWSSGFDIRRS